jgi:hypothetical protein
METTTTTTATGKNRTTATTKPAPVATPAAAQPIAAPTVQTVDLTALDLGAALGFAPGQTAVVAGKTRPVAFGVNPNARTRAHYAGLVLAQTGLANGIPPHAAGMVDSRMGAANPTESGICLRNAWHAISAYLAANGIAVPPAVPAGSNGNGIGS